MGEHSIPGDPLIQDAHAEPSVRRSEQSRQVVRIAVVGVGGGRRPIGDRVAETNDDAGVLRRFDLNALQKEVVQGGGLGREHWCSHVMPADEMYVVCNPRRCHVTAPVLSGK